MQTRRQSFFESCINVAIGYGVALMSQILIFPLFEIGRASCRERVYVLV